MGEFTEKPIGLSCDITEGRRSWSEPQAASWVFHYDRGGLRGGRQAEDRAHRIGQAKH